MEGKPRHVAVATFAVLLVAAAGASFAWACGPGAVISIDKSSGPPGTQVTVTGSRYEVEGPVEIYWNSTERLIGSATGPEFSVTVAIPEAPAGTGYIFARSTDATGAIRGSASAPFTVTDPDAPPTGEPSLSTNTSGAPGAQGSTSTSLHVAGAEPSKVRRSAPGSAVATTPGGGQVFAASLAAPRSQGRSGNGAADRPARSSAEAPAPADRIASTENLFSGLESPAVLPSPFDSAVGSESTSLLTIGVGLLGTGLVAMFAGILLAELRRRRLAETRRRTK